ncbi:MAG: peptidoglycan-binding protein [Clostridia bacterium]|nr:peptidoglycan-binding protein [Clostridia bacterium]
MTVKIGHASSSETGKISGGAAGDQSGREVYTRNWYKHSKGWVTLRFKDPLLAEYAAKGMEMACANDDIGYDQSQNQTLWNDVKNNNFDPSKTTKKVETDCARLVRLCVQYAVRKAGLNITIPDFYTATLVSVLMSTGLFEKLTESKYNTQDAYLERGMIQCTKTKGHTWIILSNGSKATVRKAEASGGIYLSRGMEGDAVKALQQNLMKLGFDLPKYGADGDFGSETEEALKAFQTLVGLPVTGIYDAATDNEMEGALVALEQVIPSVPEAPAPEPETSVTGDAVCITGGTVNVRSGPGKQYQVLDVAKKGETYPAVNMDGWKAVDLGSMVGWVSDKYIEIVKE